MYEIWSLGHKPFEAFSNSEVRYRACYSKVNEKLNVCMLCPQNYCRGRVVQL